MTKQDMENGKRSSRVTSKILDLIFIHKLLRSLENGRTQSIWKIFGSLWKQKLKEKTNMLRTFCHNLIDKLPASGLEEARDFLVSAIEFYEEYGEEEPLANQSETGEGVKVEIGGSSDKDNLALVVQVLQERVKFLEKYSHFHFETKD